jgi:hypothetical protein
METTPFNIEKFTLQGNDLNIRLGELPDMPEIFQYKNFSYNVSSVKGFCELVKAKSVKENAVIFWKQNGEIYAIMDDQVKDRLQDKILLTPAVTVEYKEWEKVLTPIGVRFDHKNYIDFLRRIPERQLDGREDLLQKIRRFTYVVKTDGEAIRNDNNNYSYALKVNGVEATVTLPASLTLYLEIFAESDLTQIIEIEHEVSIPHKEGEQLLFTLKCPTIGRYILNFRTEEMRMEHCVSLCLSIEKAPHLGDNISTFSAGI